jgi:uncharacterized protein YhaN
MLDTINGSAPPGVADDLLTTAERAALKDGAAAAARRQRQRDLRERLDLLDAQIHNTARRRLDAWREAAEREVAVEHTTSKLAARLDYLFDAKRRLVDLRAL